jgi:hypothetical protein
MARRTQSYEDEQQALNPHRSEELAAAAAGTRDRLERRGVPLDGGESPEELANLLSALERFENFVISRGGDPMVDNLLSTQPTDRAFVPPRRAAGEASAAYVERIDAATLTLMGRPAR